MKDKRKVNILIDGDGTSFYILDDLETFPDGSVTKELQEKGDGFKGIFIGGRKTTFRFFSGEIIDPISKDKSINIYYAPLAAVLRHKHITNHENPIAKVVQKLQIAQQIIHTLSKFNEKLGKQNKELAIEHQGILQQYIDQLASLQRAGGRATIETSPNFGQQTEMEREEST